MLQLPISPFGDRVVDRADVSSQDTNTGILEHSQGLLDYLYPCTVCFDNQYDTIAAFGQCKTLRIV